jgi:hypothetical protein
MRYSFDIRLNRSPIALAFDVEAPTKAAAMKQVREAFRAFNEIRVEIPGLQVAYLYLHVEDVQAPFVVAEAHGKKQRRR